MKFQHSAAGALAGLMLLFGAGTAAAADSPQAAIQQVIQRGDDEQAQAFAKHNPELMRDSSTQKHYDEMVRTNSSLAQNGVTSITLVKIDWGQISVNGATAQASAQETWRTTYDDGTTDQGTDQNNYTLVLDGGAWKVDTDDQPDTPVDAAAGGGAPSSPGQNRPAPVRPGQDVSRNWAGYAADGGKFTSVSGTWVVPQASAGSFGSDATWVGIGGVHSHDLIQAGTQEVTSGASGHVQYSAWIETLPQVSHNVPLTVSPGDSVTVSLTEQAGGQWQIAMKDNTTGQTYNTTRQYTSSESSAEWVEEAPMGAGRLVPLDNFGKVQFSAGTAVKDGQQLTIASAGAKPITMINMAGQAIASPTDLSADGNTFSVERTQAPSGQASGFGRGRRGFSLGS